MEFTTTVLSTFLKDPNVSKQERYFGRFLEKYKRVFDKSLGISFSSEKYDIVNVKKYFYEDFKTFVINDLSKIKKESLVDNWVYDLSEDRINDIRQRVNKEVARLKTQEGGIKNWDIAYEIINNDYDYIFKKVASACFRDEKHKGVQKEIARILKQEFYLSRVETPNPIENIANYEDWLFTSIRNLANRRRPQIEKEAGVPGSGEISLDDNNKGKNDSETNEEGFNSPSADTESEDTSETEGIPVIEAPDEEEFRTDLERYLSIMPNRIYADLIRAIKLENVDVDVLAEESGCTNAAIYNRMNEAMTMLVSIALPDIQRRCRKIYKRCINKMESGYHKTILVEFFGEEKSIEELSVEHKRLPKAISADLKRAYDQLKRINNGLEPETYVSEEDVSKINDKIEKSYLKVRFDERSAREKHLNSFLLSKDKIDDEKAKDYLQKFLVEKKSISDIARIYKETEDSCYKFLYEVFELIENKI